MRKLPKDRPLDPLSLDILRAVNSSAHALNVPVMLVGATARDIMLTFLHDIPARRATEDMDFALAVPNWEAFENVARALTDDPRFTMDKSMAHRILFRYSDTLPSRSVDVVPYGAGVGGEVFRWPKNDDIEMNVAGYEDAARAAELVGLASDLDFHVVPLPGFSFLKYFAWVDRRTTTHKDAFDLALILRQYGDAGNHERLFGEARQLLGAVEFDLDRASPRLLGRDVAGLCSGASHERLASLLADFRLMDALALDMVRAGGTDSTDAGQALIGEFRAGFHWRLTGSVATPG
nr:nucleotidyl transferase AbiEii/AbiGii toxin family protein [Luteibacter rhizovicinus]